MKAEEEHPVAELGRSSRAAQTPPGPSRRAAPQGGQTTTKQRAANVRNAQKSTGPKTAGGKARSSQNALKHGIYQENLQPIVKGPFAEDPDDVVHFINDIVDDLAPRDCMEGALATKIAQLVLRGARLSNWEAPHLARVADLRSVDWTAVQEQLETAAELVNYLQFPPRQLPGNWRFRLVEFIYAHSDRWSGPNRRSHGSATPPELLRLVVSDLWGDDSQAALSWAHERVSQLTAQAADTLVWDEGGAAEALIRDLHKVSAIDTQTTRNLQRLLTEYRRLQERQLFDEAGEIECDGSSGF